MSALGPFLGLLTPYRQAVHPGGGDLVMRPRLATRPTRRHGDAVRDLLEAERRAPEEVARPSVVRLVGRLLELVPSPGPELRGLAQRCGLPA
ncbi:hypothetical protein DEH18_03310 [Streptomyces sp. NHF165]|nr:hypothetical protein DEH18_03310 [Streptomyces sp. NHF165]